MKFNLLVAVLTIETERIWTIIQLVTVALCPRWSCRHTVLEAILFMKSLLIRSLCIYIWILDTYSIWSMYKNLPNQNLVHSIEQAGVWRQMYQRLFPNTCWGPDAKRVPLKVLTLLRGCWKKNDHQLSSENWVYMIFFRVTHHFHVKKGTLTFLRCDRWGSKIFRDEITLHLAPNKCLWTVP